MLNKNKYKYLLIIGICFFVLPLAGASQTALSGGEDELLKEYLFPISVGEGAPAGDPIILNGPDYDVDIEDAGNYVLQVTATNNAGDIFDNLTDDQVDFIFNTYYDEAEINNLFLDVPAIYGSKKYLFRSFVFAVYVDQATQDNLRGYLVIPNRGTEESQGSLLIENMPRGNHQIILQQISNFTYYFDPGICQGGDNEGARCRQDLSDICSGGGTCQPLPIPTENDLNDFTAIDPGLPLNPEDLRDESISSQVNITDVALDTAIVSDDIIGVRIYSNKQNKPPLRWYRDNVINASETVRDLEVDGYRGIKDDRTLYVHASNLFEQPKECRGGSNDGGGCVDSSQCPDGGQCITPKVFYTNIYVIAYNQSAAPETINIFNQMRDNWVFNKNVIEADPFNAETKKDKLRRDTIRKSHAFILQELIDRYKNINGTCPTLEAGTFVAGHTISTWPSWQANLGNQLGAGLPVDPINLMASELRSPYSCEEGNPEAVNCNYQCADPSLGCPEGQCVNNNYCSVCPPGFGDTQVCWDDLDLTFPFDIHSGCSEELNTFFNLGGDFCQNNGAFVYQYSDATCSFLIRYEYEEDEVCLPGQCFFDGQCYEPGSCVANCQDLNDDNEITDDECDYPQYRNAYCYLGNWSSSCGNGFVQSSCGESCDRSKVLGGDVSWCDATYGQQAWYNEAGINFSCNDQCGWDGVDVLGYVPSDYTNDINDVDCGGYCGDFSRQTIYGEQCDQGLYPGEVARPEDNGVGGITGNLQYLCSGAGGLTAGQPIIKQGADCLNFAEDWYEQIDFCVNNQCRVDGSACTVSADCPGFFTCADDLDDSTKLNTYDNNNLTATGGFRTSYQFELLQSGNYDLRLNSANLGDNIAGLTDDHLNEIIALAPDPSHIFNVVNSGGDNEVNIPEYGPGVPGNLRELVYSVYLDGDEVANQVGFIFMPANDQSQPTEASLNLGILGAGSHTVYLHFVGDHFWLEADQTSSLGDLSNVDLDNDNILDINPLILSASLAPVGSGVGNCQTYGGWCGDGQVQLEYDEKCDPGNFITPSPEETVSIVKNSGFEEVFTPWQADIGDSATIDLDQTDYFEGRFGLRMFSGDFAEPTQVMTLQQNNLLFKDEQYDVFLKLKPINGTVSEVSFQVSEGNNTGVWQPVAVLEPTAGELGGWQYYQLQSSPYQLSDYAYQIRFNFEVESNTLFFIDDIKIYPLNPGVRPQYQCGNDLISGEICQFRGGYCGDGIAQNGQFGRPNFGETCDDRVNLSCTSDEDCGAKGYCDSGICQSDTCNDICKSTYCGDGIVQRPNSLGINEICDWRSDPLCAFNCRQIKMGGQCTNDESDPCSPDDDGCLLCEPNTSCTVRNFGDTTTRCLGARNSFGCRSNDDCILGYYCNVSTSKCEAEVSTYLRYHPEEETVLNLPDPYNYPYDINISRCPDLQPLVGDQGKEFILDSCTGLNWDSLDNISQPGWTYADAMENACNQSYRLPTVLELYSLVGQTNQGLLYGDKNVLNLCPVKCEYDENDFEDFCNDPCGDDNYLYWSSTCVEIANVCQSGTYEGKACKTNNDCGGAICSQSTDNICAKALAVNFKYGSIEEYSTLDFAKTAANEQTQLKARCLKDTVCGNGIIDQGETCEFFIGADGVTKLEQEIDRECSEFGYDGGFLHCNPLSCTFTFNNCYFNSRLGQSCQETCFGEKALNCQSVGLNVSEQAEVFDLKSQYYNIANDNKLMDINQAGECVISDIEDTDSDGFYCDEKFSNRNVNCQDPLSGTIAPFPSQYSFCNCAE